MKSVFIAPVVALLLTSVSAEDASPEAGANPTSAYPWQENLMKQQKQLEDLQKTINENWIKLRKDQSKQYQAERIENQKKMQDQLKVQAEQSKDWSKKWAQLNIKQQLAGILDALKNQGEEIWGKDSPIPQNITMHVDTENSHIGLYSDDVDAKGRPLQQWELDKKNGVILKTKRAADGSEVHVTQKEFDYDSLLKQLGSGSIGGSIDTLVDNVKKNIKVQSTQEATGETIALTFDQEFDLEQQRDLAFKIMQFMIGFIIVTFSLLFAFFRMTQEQDQKERVNARVAPKNNDQTFIDFLSGRMDYDYIVKPTIPNQERRVPQQVREIPSSSNPYLKEQMLGQGIRKSALNHRQNTDFGGNNLEHLANDERGRFDNIDIEGTKKADFHLLGNFSNL